MKNIGIIVVILLVIAGGWFALSRDTSSAPVAEYTEQVLGKWQSVEDTQLQREFKEGGVMTDWYNGAEVMTGTWETFSSSSVPEDAVGSFDDKEAVYLRMSLTGEAMDTLYFTVESIDAQNLELIYVGSGGSVSFTKAQ